MMALFDDEINQTMFANSERAEGREEGTILAIRKMLTRLSREEILEMGYTAEQIAKAESLD